MIQFWRGMSALILAIFLASSLMAGTSFIGVATTHGTIEVNRASVRGTANISDGAAVQTNESTGQIQLDNGVRVTLGQNSAAAVYANRLELLQGASQVAAKRNYGIEALGFLVEGKNKTTLSRVAYDHQRILVTALDSELTVSKGGALIARLNPGTTYFFEQDPNGTGNNSAASAGSTSGSSGNSGAGQIAKTGLSNGVKWGIVAGAGAAATGIGVGLYVSNSGGNDNASR